MINVAISKLPKNSMCQFYQLDIAAIDLANKYSLQGVKLQAKGAK